MSEAWGVVAAWVAAGLQEVRQLSRQAPGSPITQSLAVGAVVGLLVYKLSQKRYRLPPGPFAWPVIGNLMSMSSSEEAFFVKMARWAEQKYGGAISIWLGPKLCVTLNDYETATEALIKRGDDYAGRPHTWSLGKFSEDYKSVAMADYSPEWKLQRKIAMTALRHYMTGQHLQDIVHEAVAMLAEKMTADPEPFDPAKLSTKLMFRIMEAICFGGGVKAADDPELNELEDVFLSVQNDVGNGFLEDLFPPLRAWPTNKFTKIFNTFQKFMKYVYKQLDLHRANFSPDSVKDLTGAVLLAQAEVAREESEEAMQMFTDTHVGQMMSDMFSAGIDTSRLTLDWALLLLAGNPEIQKKCQAEIDAVTGARMPGTQDRHGLPYTNAVVQETLRYGVIAPIGFPHKTMCDTQVGGYEVPKGTLIMVNQWALLHDPKAWPEPEEFRPQRFLDDSGKAKKVDAWSPFSAGRRVCLGESVAKPELLLVLACLLKRFTFVLPEGATYDAKYDASMGMGMCNPKPYKLQVVAR